MPQLHLQAPCSAMLTHAGAHPHSKVGKVLLQENVTVPKPEVMPVANPKIGSVLAQSFNTCVTLQAEELLNFTGFKHIDRELYAHTDFKYR